VRGGTRIMLADCEWFSVSMLNVEGDMPLHADGRSFHALLCVSGSCGIAFGEERLTLDKGGSAFVPAGMGEYVLSGSAQVLLSARGHAQG
ncbi:MAG: mannose-6-phosphate isomerase, partial [Clostridia bacterium]|nr:mannose-6-phosphate isomerase [Clostridia bacterium]